MKNQPGSSMSPLACLSHGSPLIQRYIGLDWHDSRYECGFPTVCPASAHFPDASRRMVAG